MKRVEVSVRRAVPLAIAGFGRRGSYFDRKFAFALINLI